MFGPDCADPLLIAALNTLLAYLAGSSASVLENVMVEKEELASSIGYRGDCRPNSVILFSLSGVATEKLAFASKSLNMNYMLDCVRRRRRLEKFQAESSWHFYAIGIINDFLFGKRDGSTLKGHSTINEFEILETWTDSQ
jgi:hypothetical protein